MQPLWRSHSYFTARELPRAAAASQQVLLLHRNNAERPKLGASKAQSTLANCTKANRHTGRRWHPIHR